MRGGDIDWGAVGGFAGMTAAFVWGVMSNLRLARHRKQKSDDAIAVANAELLKAQMSLLDTTKGERDSWKQRYETEHSEGKQYQAEAHERINKAQEMVLRLTDENAQLKAKTDLTPVLRTQDEQGKMMLQMAEAMQKITLATTQILDRMEANRK